MSDLLSLNDKENFDIVIYGDLYRPSKCKVCFSTVNVIDQANHLDWHLLLDHNIYESSQSYLRPLG